jgi:hypothetical protein
LHFSKPLRGENISAKPMLKRSTRPLPHDLEERRHGLWAVQSAKGWLSAAQGFDVAREILLYGSSPSLRQFQVECFTADCIGMPANKKLKRSNPGVVTAGVLTAADDLSREIDIR